MKKRDNRFKIEKVFGVLLVLGLFVVGCSKEEPQEPLDPYNKPYSRLEDAAYTNALHTQMEKRMDVFKRIQAVEDEIKAAEAKDPKSAEVEALRAKRAALEDEFRANRKQTEQLIRMRILRENAAIEAREARENKANNNISSKGN